MREIKFRAWDKELGKFVYPEDVWLGNSNETLDELIKEYCAQQYTGLKDKNGVEIYEGDILKSDGVVISEVVWNELLCGFSPFVEQVLGAIDSYSEWQWKEHEVIGNIYENPELLTSE